MTTLPPRVHVKSGRYYLVQNNRWIALTRVSEGEPALLESLREVKDPRPRTVAELFDSWLRAEHGLAAKTMRDYRAALTAMPTTKDPNRITLRRVFGRMAPRDLTQSLVAQYLERRGGVKANREVAALGSVCSWAMRKGWLESNPTNGVRRNREKPRERYVTNRELGQALKRAHPATRDIMLAAYLTGLRQGDLRELTKDSVAREGLKIVESKKGKRVVVTWSGPLKALVLRSLARSQGDHVFTSPFGKPWSFWGLQSAMRRLEVDWTFHDLRAKAESDHRTGMGLLSRYKRARRIAPVG